MELLWNSNFCKLGICFRILTSLCLIWLMRLLFSNKVSKVFLTELREDENKFVRLLELKSSFLSLSSPLNALSDMWNSWPPEKSTSRRFGN